MYGKYKSLNGKCLFPAPAADNIKVMKNAPQFNLVELVFVSVIFRLEGALNLE